MNTTSKTGDFIHFIHSKTHFVLKILHCEKSVINSGNFEQIRVNACGNFCMTKKMQKKRETNKKYLKRKKETLDDTFWGMVESYRITYQMTYQSG